MKKSRLAFILSPLEKSPLFYPLPLGERVGVRGFDELNPYYKTYR